MLSCDKVKYHRSIKRTIGKLINLHMERLISEFEMFCMYITFSEKEKNENKVVIPLLVILTVTCNVNRNFLSFLSNSQPSSSAIYLNKEIKTTS